MSNLEHFALNATAIQVQQISAFTASFESSAVDLSGYRGGLLAVLEAINKAGTSPTLDIKFQSATTSGGTYADITGFTFPQITTQSLGATTVKMVGTSVEAAKPWVKAVGTIGGTNSPQYEVAIALAAVKQYQ